MYVHRGRDGIYSSVHRWLVQKIQQINALKTQIDKLSLQSFIDDYKEHACIPMCTLSMLNNNNNIINNNNNSYLAQMSFYLSHYTEYNQQWNVFSAFNPSKCTHTWNSGQPTLRRPGSSWGFSALLKGLTSVMDHSCRSRDSNPQPRVTSPTLSVDTAALSVRRC